MIRSFLTVGVIFGALAGSAGAFDLGDLLDREDQREAREHNVRAGNADVYDVAPPTVFQAGFGAVSRRTTCLADADCAQRPVTTGNYLWARERGPWLVYQSYIGRVSTDTGLHPEGDLTAFNVVEIPEQAIPPGGLHIRSFGGGILTQRIRSTRR